MVDMPGLGRGDTMYFRLPFPSSALPVLSTDVCNTVSLKISSGKEFGLSSVYSYQCEGNLNICQILGISLIPQQDTNCLAVLRILLHRAYYHQYTATLHTASANNNSLYSTTVANWRLIGCYVHIPSVKLSTHRTMHIHMILNSSHPGRV